MAIMDGAAHDFLQEMRQSVREGLSRGQKTIPCKYLYDARGSELFNRICALPEYYPARTETMIIERHARDIMKSFLRGPGDLIDIGSGSPLKARILLEAVPLSRTRRVRCIPVDICREGLAHYARGLSEDFPELAILGITGDFTASLQHLPRRRKLVCFFGSTFGNFSDEEAVNLLRVITRVMGPEDSLLVGLDMLKPIGIIEAAYNDRAGITAAFNLNILMHMNEMLGADFDPCHFAHQAFFNKGKGRIEMHLKAVRNVTAHVADIGLTVKMARGETIRTEISRKFSRPGATELFSRAGLKVRNWYEDDRAWFSLADLGTGQRSYRRYVHAPMKRSL